MRHMYGTTALEQLWNNPRLVLEHFNPIALRKAKIVCNFGLSECNMVKNRSTKLNEMMSGTKVLEQF